uniref:Uncharacterized protein n=1 Tax=Anguilla anguilla TaxID=7936 RepID=A0A0E9UMY6_ANGAN
MLSVRSSARIKLSVIPKAGSFDDPSNASVQF